MIRTFAVALAFGVFAATGGQAAEESGASVVGTTVLGGKRVELLSDNTWRFSEFSSSDKTCVPINSVLEFCGSILDWRPTSTLGSEFTRMFRRNERTYAGVIYEEIGEMDGLDVETMRNIVIENVAMMAAVPPEEIPIMDLQPNAIDNIPVETMVYGAHLSGLDVVYQNSIIVTEGHTMQFVVWTVGDDLTEAAEAANRNFLEGFRVTLPEGRL